MTTGRRVKNCPKLRDIIYRRTLTNHLNLLILQIYNWRILTDLLGRTSSCDAEVRRKINRHLQDRTRCPQLHGRSHLQHHQLQGDPHGVSQHDGRLELLRSLRIHVDWNSLGDNFYKQMFQKARSFNIKKWPQLLGIITITDEIVFTAWNQGGLASHL